MMLCECCAKRELSALSFQQQDFGKQLEVKQPEMIPTLKEGNISAVDDHQKVHMLNTFFSKCWNNTGPSLTETSNYQYPAQFQNKSVTMEDFICTVQSRKSIIIMLKNLNTCTDKATGSDNISGHMLKATARSLTPSLTQLFNL